MNVLLPIPTPQDLVFIPRYNTGTVNLTITNEETNEKQDFEITTTYDNGYMVVSISYPFTEGGNYIYTVRDLTSAIMYNGKIFTTAQTDLQNYNINKDLLQI